MAILTEVCNSFKLDMLLGRHDFTLSTGDSFKLALYVTAANLGKATTAYTATSESSVTGGEGTGYTAGGGVLTNVTPVLDVDTAICDFSPDLVFTIGGTAPVLNANGCLIYNDTITTPVADPSVASYLFASDTTATGVDATFTVVFPAAAAATAVLRLA